MDSRSNIARERQSHRTAVVTGGAGFIGSHIVDELVELGYHVIVIDDISTGRLENIEHLLKKRNLEFFRGSVTDQALLQRRFSGVDYVFHQAAISSVPASIDNPSAVHEVNATGTLNVLLAARDNQVKKVVYASSASVYGDSPNLPVQESMMPNPQSPYAVSKLAGEYYCHVFSTVYHLATVCLRGFNIYGPRQNSDSEYAAVIPKFIKYVSDGKSPVIFGDGEQTRDFMFVKDIVAANILAAQSDATGIFNIGQGESTSLNQLTRLILRLMGRDDIKPIYEKERVGDIKHSLADITRARTLGYTPKYTLEEGLREVIRSL